MGWCLMETPIEQWGISDAAERNGCEPQELLGREAFEQQLLFFVLRLLPKPADHDRVFATNC
jgi:hypothetical protein